MKHAEIDFGRLAREAQERASQDPRRVAPELHWTLDQRGWVAGKEARAFTKGRWGVRPDRVVCRPGYPGIYIHGAGPEQGISWLAYLNGDVRPQGETFKRLLEDLCGRVAIPYRQNGTGSTDTAEPLGLAVRPRKLPRVWPFTVQGARFHAYPGYWVCILPRRKGAKKVLQYRALSDGSVASGLSAGRFWRSPRSQKWYPKTGKKKPPANAEWRQLPACQRSHTYRHERVAGAVKTGKTILFLEGEKDVETAEGLGLVADTNPGGAGKLTAPQAAPYRGAEVVVIPDNDPAGIDGGRKTAAVLTAAGARVALLDPLGGEPGSGFDFSDWIEVLRHDDPERWQEGLQEALREKIARVRQPEPPPVRPRSIEIRDFLATRLKPRSWIIRNLIQEKDIAMIYAKRGVGKTYAAQAVAWAVITGGSWLRFEVERPTEVLYIDGEMPREDLQERFAAIARGSERDPVTSLRLLSEDLDDLPIPSLATPDGQSVVETELAAYPEIGLIVIDAVSTLCHDPHANESDAKSWDAMQSWLLSLRRRGIASLILHHSGKGGDQRGTSKREDVMTQVLRLERPLDYRPEEGARFEIHFVKARGVLGDAARPLEVQLTSDADGNLGWTFQDLEGSKKRRAAEMFDDGLKASDVQEELNVSRATAYRWQKEWRQESR